MERDEQKSNFNKWLVGTGAISVLAIAGAISGLFKDSIDIEDRNEQKRQEREADISNQAAERAVELREFERISNAAMEGQAFARCWPTSTCPGLDALPVDETQDGRLSELEAEATTTRAALRGICQGLRDREPSNKWPDCVKLGL